MKRFLLLLIVLIVLAPLVAIFYSGAPLTASPGLFTRVHYYLTENEAATEQASAWPEREPLQARRPPEQVYQAVRATVSAMDWQVSAENPGDFTIHAFASTPLLAFKDDVRIRVETLDDGGTLVHVHSASRVGKVDFGRNSARLLRFRETLSRRL